MRNSGKILAIFILLFVLGGFSLLWQFLETTGTMVYYFIFSVLKIMPHLPTSIFDVIENIISSNWNLTKIAWIDSTLIHIASFLPSGIIFILGVHGLKLNPKISAVLSFLTFIMVLQLFSSIVFWIILAIIILAIIGFSINGYVKSMKEEQTIIKEAENNSVEEQKLEPIREQIIIETNKYFTLYELWKQNNNRPFNAYNSVNGNYVYISSNPTIQYAKYGKIYGRLSKSKNTYKYGFNCEIFYGTKPIWELL